MSSLLNPFKTRASMNVPIDLKSRQATIAQQWFLENARSLPIHTGCAIQTFIGGEDGFRSIEADIRAARDSINLVCWGFDPGMALVREKQDKAYPWTLGEPYGELLRRKAAEGVKVRLLVWYEPQGSAKQKSLPGYVNPDEFVVGGVINSTWDELLEMRVGGAAIKAGLGDASGLLARARPPKPLWAQRQDYCTHWWRQATSGQIPNLEVRGRAGVPDKVMDSLRTEVDPPGKDAAQYGGFVHEKTLMEKHATHHQKPILIDYGCADASPVGYVMGLNSTTDYWDSQKHSFDDVRRELQLFTSDERAGDAALKNGKPISRRPLQDYACRLQGPVLRDVWTNFCNAWNRAPLLPKLAATSNAGANSRRSPDLSAAMPAPPPLPPMGTGMAGGAHTARLQIVRTQPEEPNKSTLETTPCDKSIKQLYFQACESARNYIYLENQYFYYEEWARYLKCKRQDFMSHVQTVGKTNKDARLLHLIVVIPQPEDAGMVPRTYDTLKSLGQGDSMPAQRQLYADLITIENERIHWSERYNALSPEDRRYGTHRLGTAPELTQTQRRAKVVAQTADKVKEPTLNADGVLMQDGKSLGLKVLVCSMAAPNLDSDKALGMSRPIYIHSKLMLVDDCLMTLGSANLNQRSMAVDSEINVVTDSIPHNRDLRKRVWGMQTGGLLDGGAGTPTPAEMAEVFQKWKTLAADNANAIEEKRPVGVKGFLMKFTDTRIATYRVG